MFITRWYLERRTALPILTGKGTCEDRAAEIVLIDTALKLIEGAEQFKGRPLSEDPKERASSAVEVQINIIFPSNEEMYKFVQFIQAGNIPL